MEDIVDAYEISGGVCRDTVEFDFKLEACFDKRVATTDALLIAQGDCSSMEFRCRLLTLGLTEQAMRSAFKRLLASGALIQHRRYGGKVKWVTASTTLTKDATQHRKSKALRRERYRNDTNYHRRIVEIKERMRQLKMGNLQLARKLGWPKNTLKAYLNYDVRLWGLRAEAIGKCLAIDINLHDMQPPTSQLKYIPRDRRTEIAA